MSDTIEVRLARVERELAILRAKSTRDKSNWLSEIIGTFKDDADFDEIVRLGKEMRDLAINALAWSFVAISSYSQQTS